MSYRERDLLGRSLTIDEAREVTNIARRIAAILLVEPELDANYQAVKQVLLYLASFRQSVRRYRYATRSPEQSSILILPSTISNVSLPFYAKVLEYLGFRRVAHESYIAWSNGHMGIGFRAAPPEEKGSRI